MTSICGDPECDLNCGVAGPATGLRRAAFLLDSAGEELHWRSEHGPDDAGELPEIVRNVRAALVHLEAALTEETAAALVGR